MIQTLEVIPRACMLNFLGSWVEKVSLVGFVYNDSYHQFLEMLPFEASYGISRWLPIHWHKTRKRRFLRPDEVDAISREIEIIKRRLQTTVNKQKKYTQNRRRPLEFKVKD